MLALSLQDVGSSPSDEFLAARIAAARAARELLRTDHNNVKLFAQRSRAAADATAHLASLAALAERKSRR